MDQRGLARAGRSAKCEALAAVEQPLDGRKIPNILFRHKELALEVGVGKGMGLPSEEIIDREFGVGVMHGLPPISLGVLMKIHGFCG